MNEVFYKPEGAWAADFIPYFDPKENRFHLFYLHDWRDRQNFGEGTPWYRISTTDLVHYTEHGEMLPRGTIEEQDLYVFTGSVIHALGQYHIFYTGHNPYFRQQGKAEQAIMHAVSDDLQHWQKIPADTFYADPERYEPHDWRDPFVFWNEEAGAFWMLLAARLKEGAPSRRRGCTALCTSKDLKTWQVGDPFYAPNLYYTHECPDLFRIGGWWYLVFSEFSEKLVTRYRMSRSLKGPWLAPMVDTFDDSYFYAAKTASDGTVRYLFGWNATREGNQDFAPGQWGGNLAVHEIVQQEDGTLDVCLPESIQAHFRQPVEAAFRPGTGKSVIQPDFIQVDAEGSFASAVGGDLPDPCMVEARIAFNAATRDFGLLLRLQEDGDHAYYVRLQPNEQQVVFDAWLWEMGRPRTVELRRPVRRHADPSFLPSGPAASQAGRGSTAQAGAV